MKRRRLNQDDAPREQFSALRQIPTLTHEQCRQVVALLHPEEEGRHTCVRPKDVHPEALPCLRDISIDRDGTPLKVHCMALSALIEAKIKLCPLFAACMERMYKAHGPEQPLIFYADDTQGGNTLAATATRKSTLIYAAFLNFEFLHLEALWLTLSVIKASDVETCKGGLASVASALLSFYKQETECGIPVRIGEQGHELLFIPHILWLSDHEGIRAALGCKGSAGYKPCIKCKNVVAAGRAGIAAHVDICCIDVNRFVKQRQEDVEDILGVLSAQGTKKLKEQAEVMLGFKLSSLVESPLGQRQLRGFFRLEFVQYDAMHHLFSNGIIAEELGLWFAACHEGAGVTADHMRRYACVAWNPVKGGQAEAPRPDSLFGEKLWKLTADFRGDAQACLHALPLCVAYGEDMLRDGYPSLSPVLDSLKALHQVAQCVKACKANAAASGHLLPLQQAHMRLFIAAYSANACRPKMHYQLHLKEQMDLWGKSIDCFGCERKHRQYKAICAAKLTCSQRSFARSALLELSSQELSMPLNADKLGTSFVSKVSVSCALTKILRTKVPVQVASALQHRSIRYGKGLFVLLSNGLGAEIICAIHTGEEFALLVEILKPLGDHKNPGRSLWKRPGPGECSRALLPVTKNFNSDCTQFMYVRHDNNMLWLLQ